MKHLVVYPSKKSRRGWNSATKSPLRWVGGKGGHYNKVLRLPFKKLIKAAPPGASFYFPFLGGAGDLIELAKENPKLQLVGNDLDPDVFNLFKIIEAGLVAGIFPHLPKDRDLTRRKAKAFRRIHQATPERGGNFERAARFLVLNQTKVNGNMKGGFPKLVENFRYDRKKLIKSLKEVQSLLRGRFKVYNLDAKEFIRDIIPAGQPFYADPPYHKQGRACYRHFFNDQQHQELAEILKPLKNWLLSYDNCRDVRHLYSWARRNRQAFQYYSAGWVQKKVELLIRPVQVFRPCALPLGDGREELGNMRLEACAEEVNELIIRQ